MKFAMAMGKEMTFAVERFKALCKQVKEAKSVNGFAEPELLNERNNAADEAIALIRQVEEHMTGEWKERLHKLHLGLEKWKKEESKYRI